MNSKHIKLLRQFIIETIELSNKIEKVLKMSKEQLQEVGNNARLKIETDFSIRKLTNELKNLFESADQGSYKSYYETDKNIIKRALP